eukprot:gene9372-21566_t
MKKKGPAAGDQIRVFAGECWVHGEVIKNNSTSVHLSSAAGDVDVFQKASLTWRAMSKMDAPATSIAALDNDTVELIAQRFQVATAEVMRLNRGRISGLRPKAKMIEGTLILVPADAAAAPKGGKGKVKKKKGGKTGVTSATPTTKPFDSPFRPAKRRRGSNTPTTPPPVVTGRGSPKDRKPVLPRAPPRLRLVAPAAKATRPSARDARSKARTAAAKMDEQSDDDEGAAEVQPRGRGRRTSAATTASEATPTPTHNRKRPRASSAAASSDERSNAGSDSTAA